MNNEKLHRDQKGENQQYINTNPSRETRLPGQESRGLWPIQTWGKKRSPAHPHPWTPTPPRASAGASQIATRNLLFHPWPLTHNVPFPWISYSPVFTQWNTFLWDFVQQQLPPQADLQLWPRSSSTLQEYPLPTANLAVKKKKRWGEGHTTQHVGLNLHLLHCKAEF